jgi:hypothetical protein
MTEKRRSLAWHRGDVPKLLRRAANLGTEEILFTTLILSEGEMPHPSQNSVILSEGERKAIIHGQLRRAGVEGPSLPGRCAWQA